MKPLPRFLLVVLASAYTLRAEPFLGSTEAQVIARYGKPMRESREAPAEKVLIFSRDGIRVMAWIFKGTVGQVAYLREAGGEFIREEAEKLLSLNGEGWRPMALENYPAGSDPRNLRWYVPLPDGKNAMCEKGTMIVQTKEFLAAWKRAQVDSLKGL